MAAGRPVTTEGPAAATWPRRRPPTPPRHLSPGDGVVKVALYGCHVGVFADHFAPLVHTPRSSVALGGSVSSPHNPQGESVLPHGTDTHALVDSVASRGPLIPSPLVDL